VICINCVSSIDSRAFGSLDLMASVILLKWAMISLSFSLSSGSGSRAEGSYVVSGFGGSGRAGKEVHFFVGYSGSAVGHSGAGPNVFRSDVLAKEGRLASERDGTRRAAQNRARSR
jgi:hypothetical protein